MKYLKISSIAIVFLLLAVGFVTIVNNHSGNAASSDLSWPWYLSRAAAIVAYILMFVMIVLGEGLTTGFAYKVINPVKAWVIHKYIGIALGLAVLFHILSLLFDTFINFSAPDLFIPFVSSYHPF